MHAAHGAPRGVEVETHPQLPVPGAHGGVDQVEVLDGVDHERHLGPGVLVAREVAQRGAVHRRVADEHVVAGAVPDVPERLAQRVAHEPRDARPVDRALDEGAAPQGLGGEPDREPRRPRDEVVEVGVEGVEIDDRERRVEVGGGAIPAVDHTGDATVPG